MSKGVGQGECSVSCCGGQRHLAYYDLPVCCKHWFWICELTDQGVKPDQIVEQLTRGRLQKPLATGNDLKPQDPEKPGGEPKMAKTAKYAYEKGNKTKAGCEILGTEKNDNGNVHMLTIRCSHPGCSGKRRIKVQDAFQVRYCDEHRTKASRNEGDKAGKTASKKKAEKASPAKKAERKTRKAPAEA